MNPFAEETLDCQDCGTVLRVLSPEEAQTVADKPHDYVRYCRSCAPDRVREYEEGRAW